MHPNTKANGVYLRGFPQRKYLENGDINPSWVELGNISPALAKRTYHADTLGLTYIPFVQLEFVPVVGVETRTG